MKKLYFKEKLECGSEIPLDIPPNILMCPTHTTPHISTPTHTSLRSRGPHSCRHKAAAGLRDSTTRPALSEPAVWPLAYAPVRRLTAQTAVVADRSWCARRPAGGPGEMGVLFAEHVWFLGLYLLKA